MKKRYTVFANKRRRNVRASRYSDSVPYENRKYWYFTTHGIGPGMLPSDVHILDTQEGQNRKGTWGDYILLDAVLNTDELREFDLVELAPKEIEDKMVSRTAPRSKGSRFNNYIFPDDVESATKVRSRRAIKASVDDAEVDLTFIGEPSAIMDLKNAALSAGDTITRFNANTLIIHTWDYVVDEYMEYANDLGLSVDDVSYVKSAKKITCSYEDDEDIIKKKEQDFIKFAKSHPSTPSLIIDKYIDNKETCSYYYGMEFDEDGSIFDSLPDACKEEMYRRYDNGEYDEDDEDDYYWETGVGRDE